MTLQEEIEHMTERLVGGERKRISQRIRLYSSGVSAKLRNAEYSLVELSKLAAQSDMVTGTDEPEFSVNERIQFFVDSFFAFLYSAFDVISQVVNQKMRLGINEDDVSFKRVGKMLVNQHTGSSVEAVYTRISRSYFFKNLERYRNCSTHRRQIYIRAETVQISETPGYSATGKITTVRRFLCDNPLTLTPSVKQERELLSYCQRMYNKACKEIAQIARIL